MTLGYINEQSRQTSLLHVVYKSSDLMENLSDVLLGWESGEWGRVGWWRKHGDIDSQSKEYIIRQC